MKLNKILDMCFSICDDETKSPDEQVDAMFAYLYILKREGSLTDAQYKLFYNTIDNETYMSNIEKYLSSDWFEDDFNAASKMNHRPVKIVSAATKFGDRVIMSVRHCDPIMWAQVKEHSIPRELIDVRVEGFIDNQHNFHDREAALKIAIENGQVDPANKIGYAHELFSEDLY